MVMSLDGLHVCEACGDEFPLRAMDGAFCQACRTDMEDEA